MDPCERFAALLNGPPDELRLDVGCALLAQAFKGGELAVDVVDGLDELAGIVTDRTFDGLMAALFTDRLRGNPFDYYDARNSFLDDVLLRGVGIPITLSVIAMEVGRRIGVEVEGIGLPGHFIVGDPTSCAYADPFHGPGIHDRSSMLAVWRRMHAGSATVTESMFAPVTPRQILLRMLNNLKGIYLTVGDQREVGALVRLREGFAELREEIPDHARWLRHWN